MVGNKTIEAHGLDQSLDSLIFWYNLQKSQLRYHAHATYTCRISNFGAQKILVKPVYQELSTDSHAPSPFGHENAHNL